MKIVFSLFTLVLQLSGIGFLCFPSFATLLSTCPISKSHHLRDYICFPKKLVIVSLSPEVFAQRLFYLIRFCHKVQCHFVGLSSISVLFCFVYPSLFSDRCRRFDLKLASEGEIYVGNSKPWVQHFKEHTGILYKSR